MSGRLALLDLDGPMVLVSTGPGIAGYRSYIVAAVVLTTLTALAWWTLRPARRATRAEVLRARRDGRDVTSGSDEGSQQ